MIGFDNDKYIMLQSEKIMQKINGFDKLYLEFGGKLFDDYHAMRVLPGFESDVKVKMLNEIKDDVEILFCISAIDIEKNKIRADFGITYDMEVLRLMDRLRERGLYVSGVVVTLYTGQPLAQKFGEKLQRRNEKVFFHSPTKGYPTDIKTIISKDGYGANPYIPTTRKVVIVTAPGPKSGKLGTCLSQMYHDYNNGINAGYAKFETFPVWNLSLSDNVNIAYEAATADVKDVNMIDPYYLEKYNKSAVNYNRDIEVYPILKEILYKITGNSEYYTSPTDMGVNTIAECILDNDVVQRAAAQEIIRRYYRAKVDYLKGHQPHDTAERINLLMNKSGITALQRKSVSAALSTKSKCATSTEVVSIELPSGQIVTGKAKDILSAAAAALLNALKTLAEIPDRLKLLKPEVLMPILKMQNEVLNRKKTLLSSRDVLMALSVGAVSSDVCALALDQATHLANCDAHSTSILSSSDEDTFRRLKLRLTSEPKFSNSSLFDE